MGKSDVEANIRPEDLDKFCFCCQRVQDKPIGIEGVCPECEKNQKWYETGTHTMHKKMRIEAHLDGKVDISETVQILPHGRGWVVNGQKVLK